MGTVEQPRVPVSELASEQCEPNALAWATFGIDASTAPLSGEKRSAHELEDGCGLSQMFEDVGRHRSVGNGHYQFVAFELESLGVAYNDPITVRPRLRSAASDDHFGAVTERPRRAC